MLSLIVNPSAGGGRAGRLLPGVRAQLGRMGLEHRVELTKSLDHACELAFTAATAGEMVVAFGGDGTVGAVAGALKHTDAVLGVLPGGRGNDFARGIGLPMDPRAACETLAGGQVSAVDLGRVGGKTFLGIATSGFDSEANRIANNAKHVPARFVYAYGGVRALMSWKPASFTLRLDGEQHLLYGYNVAVCNSGRHGAGMLLAPQASPTDGMFEVVMIAQAPKHEFLRQLPKVFKGTHVSSPFVRIARAHAVDIASDRPFTTYADGDPVAVLPARFTVLPAAVKVMVPPALGPTPERSR
jgi:YegS/Rv2252/BmrU family lipid kinase